MDPLHQVQAIGIPWYREADYQTLRNLFIDGHKLSPSFLQWQDSANQVRKRYIRQGKIVVQAYIDPIRFPAWCSEHGHQVDAQGRMAFANAEAFRVMKETNNR